MDTSHPILAGEPKLFIKTSCYLPMDLALVRLYPSLARGFDLHLKAQFVEIKSKFFLSAPGTELAQLLPINGSD